jgi:hypothetical protein
MLCWTCIVIAQPVYECTVQLLDGALLAWGQWRVVYGRSFPWLVIPMVIYFCVGRSLSTRDCKWCFDLVLSCCFCSTRHPSRTWETQLYLTPQSCWKHTTTPKLFSVLDPPKDPSLKSNSTTYVTKAAPGIQSSQPEVYPCTTDKWHRLLKDQRSMYSCICCSLPHRLSAPVFITTSPVPWPSSVPSTRCCGARA